MESESSEPRIISFPILDRGSDPYAVAAGALRLVDRPMDGFADRYSAYILEECVGKDATGSWTWRQVVCGTAIWDGDRLRRLEPLFSGPHLYSQPGDRRLEDAVHTLIADAIVNRSAPAKAQEAVGDAAGLGWPVQPPKTRPHADAFERIEAHLSGRYPPTLDPKNWVVVLARLLGRIAEKTVFTPGYETDSQRDLRECLVALAGKAVQFIERLQAEEEARSQHNTVTPRPGVDDTAYTMSID